MINVLSVTLMAFSMHPNMHQATIEDSLKVQIYVTNFLSLANLVKGSIRCRWLFVRSKLIAPHYAVFFLFLWNNFLDLHVE